MTVHVPFEFALRDRVLPAGDYSVRELTDDGAAITIRSADSREALTVLSSNADAQGRQSAAPRLVFRRYGDQYFLAAIWLNANNGRAINKSHRERSLQKELAQAGRAVEPEVITVAAELAVR
jgi:hypothetical protein